MEKLPTKVSEFLVANAPVRQEPGDITVAMACETWNVKHQAARNQLRKLVEEGKLKEYEGVILDDGGIGSIFRPVE